VKVRRLMTVVCLMGCGDGRIIPIIPLCRRAGSADRHCAIAQAGYSGVGPEHHASALDLMKLGPGFGEFDYIIALGFTVGAR
jgi:hypothetical protein